MYIYIYIETNVIPKGIIKIDNTSRCLLFLKIFKFYYFYLFLSYF